MRRWGALLATFAFATIAVAYGQQGQWAKAGDATAKFMVDAERQWAESACNNNKIIEKILAEDFQGTSPSAKRYTKSEALAEPPDSSKTYSDCRLIDASVRFFGDKLAIVYGSEGLRERSKDGTERSECLIWTDTWLRRDGKWQIIAVQDMAMKCP